MSDLEERLRTYAAAAIEEASPVTAEEVRGMTRPARPMMTRLLAIAVVLLALAGVSAAVVLNDDDATRVTSGPPSFPLTLDGHRDWNVAVLNGEVAATDEQFRARYSEDFVDAVSAEEFRSTSEPLIALGAWRVISEVERRGEELLAVQLASASGEQARLTIHRDRSGKVDGSTILIAVPCADPVATDGTINGPLNERFGWITELLGATSTPSDEELRERFAPSFLSAVPPDRLRAGLPQLRDLGPYTLRSFEGPPSAYSLSARLGVRTGEEARLTLAIEPDPPHRITGFSVFTQPPCRITGNS